tara:strand:- start:1489 stop:2808 length:1320 start_codon:yes stop_codon:yes gene_type:complete
MGLGVALTGFLTGFAERATVEIDTRNKELRKTISDRLAKYQDTVSKEYADKIEERKLAKKRASILRNIKGLELSIPQQAALVTSEASFNSFIKATEDKSPKEIKALSTNLKFGDTVKGNLDPKKPMTLNQAIDLRTEFKPTTPLPGVTDTTTAFGMNSDIQQKALDNFAAENPELVPSGTQLPLNSDTVQFLKPNSKKRFNLEKATELANDFVTTEIVKNVKTRNLGKINVGSFLKVNIVKPNAQNKNYGNTINVSVGKNNPVAEKYLENITVDATIKAMDSLDLGNSGVLNMEEATGLANAFRKNALDNFKLNEVKRDGNNYIISSFKEELLKVKNQPFKINDETVSFAPGYENIQELLNKSDATQTLQKSDKGISESSPDISQDNAKIITTISQFMKANVNKKPEEIQKLFAAKNFINPKTGKAFKSVEEARYVLQF